MARNAANPPLVNLLQDGLGAGGQAPELTEDPELEGHVQCHGDGGDEEAGEGGEALPLRDP